MFNAAEEYWFQRNMGAGRKNRLHKMCIRDRNKTLLRNTLVLHEKKQAEIKNDTRYVEEMCIRDRLFTIHGISGGSILHTDFNCIPMVGLQKVGGIGILFQDGFNLCIRCV